MPDKMTVLAEDGLRHVVSDLNKHQNGWRYRFLCRSDIGWATQGDLTDEAPTCLQCITKHDAQP
jgi:hypothetical protein